MIVRFGHEIFLSVFLFLYAHPVVTAFTNPDCLENLLNQLRQEMKVVADLDICIGDLSFRVAEDEFPSLRHPNDPAFAELLFHLGQFPKSGTLVFGVGLKPFHHEKISPAKDFLGGSKGVILEGLLIESALFYGFQCFFVSKDTFDGISLGYSQAQAKLEEIQQTCIPNDLFKTGFPFREPPVAFSRKRRAINQSSYHIVFLRILIAATRARRSSPWGRGLRRASRGS